MNKQEIFNTLEKLPQFVNPSEISTPDGDRLNEDWLRLYDITSYQFVSINDNIVEFNLENDMWFDLSNKDLDKFIEKQELKGKYLEEKIEKIEKSNIDLEKRIDSVSHLNLGDIHQENADFPLEWQYYFNTNNNSVLSINKESNIIAFTRGLTTGYFENEAVIKILEVENALSQTKFEKTFLSELDEERHETKLKLKNIL